MFEERFRAKVELILVIKMDDEEFLNSKFYIIM